MYVEMTKGRDVRSVPAEFADSFIDEGWSLVEDAAAPAPDVRTFADAPDVNEPTPDVRTFADPFNTESE